MFTSVEIIDPQEEHGHIVVTTLHGDHRANRLLATLELADFAVLEPHLETVALPKGALIVHVAVVAIGKRLAPAPQLSLA